MNKRIILLLGATLGLTACATTENAAQLATQLSYEVAPDQAEVLTTIEPIIRASLKDPDSLKNLKISASYQCYASKMGFTDNVSPKYDYGYWCYDFTYNATNSYGGYVPGQQFAIYHQGQLLNIKQINETVRQSDNAWNYHSPNEMK